MQGEINPDNSNYRGTSDSHIRYSEMVRNRGAAQYVNNVSQPLSMSYAQQHLLASQSDAGYGGYNQAQRRMSQDLVNQTKRMTYAGSAAAGVADLAIYGAMSGVGTTAASGMALTGAASIGMTVAAPMAAAAVVGAALVEPIRGEVARRQYASNISVDLDRYRGRIGFDHASTREISNLGKDMQRSMYGGGFFSKDQQMNIHKLGLSEGLVSGRSAGGKSSMDQYKKNFDELKFEEILKKETL